MGNRLMQQLLFGLVSLYFVYRVFVDTILTLNISLTKGDATLAVRASVTRSGGVCLIVGKHGSRDVSSINCDAVTTAG